jgi:7-cyano-7-deazaguanine synthase in queuosine biosynthesis
VADYLQIPLKIIDASGLWPSFVDVAGEERFHLMTSSAISPSPGILIGATYAAWAGAKTLYLGLVKEDIDGRPWLLDLVRIYNSALACIRPSLKAFPPGGDEFSDFRILAPFASTTKTEMIQKAIDSNSLAAVETLVAMTWSCQFSEDQECGQCFICQLKSTALRRLETVASNSTVTLMD